MKKLLTSAAATILLTFAISVTSLCQEDSMANFKALITSARSSASDMGAMIAPEIYSAVNYPIMPQPGQQVTVRTMIGNYNSVADYNTVSVKLTYWKKGGSLQTTDMKVEDAAHGIYSAQLPKYAEGDQVFYTIKAIDSWGNVAIEVPPTASLESVVVDNTDKDMDASMDIRELFASYNEAGELQTCMDLGEKAKRMIGNDIALYGLVLFSRDFRYKPEYTENEFSGGFIGAYIPNLMIKDLVPTSELFDLLKPGKKRVKRGSFSEKGNRLCFKFRPDVIRDDYEAGIKLVGATIAASLSPMAIKPTDTTRTVMLYPTVHSFSVNSIK